MKNENGYKIYSTLDIMLANGWVVKTTIGYDRHQRNPNPNSWGFCNFISSYMVSRFDNEINKNISEEELDFD